MVINLKNKRKNMKHKFKKGDVVTSNQRTEGSPLFLMVLDDENQVSDQFKGVVLRDGGTITPEYEREGFITNSWNTDAFDRSSFASIYHFDTNYYGAE